MKKSKFSVALLTVAYVGLLATLSHSLVSAKILDNVSEHTQQRVKKIAKDKMTTAKMADLLKQNDNFIILTHSNPDGDAIGSATALCMALHKIGKNARVLVSDNMDSKYQFLFQGLKKQEFEGKCIISVDVQNESYMDGDCARYRGKVDFCIDHHPQEKMYAKLSLIDTKAAAAAEIVYEVIKNLGDNLIDSQVAAKLFTAITTDTGCFKYSNVTSKTFKIASELIGYDIDIATINRKMFDIKSKSKMKLEAKILDSLETYFEGRCAVISITQQMLRETGLSTKDSGGFAHIPCQCEGAFVGVTLIENPDGSVKVSMRTVDGKVDANEICKKFPNGGGHAAAAGCTIKGSIESARKQILSAIEKFLR